MCDYAQNIDAANKWEAGMVVRHMHGHLYTLLSDGRFFSHGNSSPINGEMGWRDYSATRRKNFVVLA